MPRLLIGLAAAAGVLLTGCSLMPEHSLDYRQARNLAPLVLPEGATARNIQPLYAIPDLPPARATVALTEGNGRKQKFLIPAPADMPASDNEPTAGGQPTVTVAKPRLASDGNGAPILQVDGNAEQVWDNLGKALENSKVRVDDRNRSLGVYFIKLQAQDKSPDLQLKMSRTEGTMVLFLQINEDTVADAETARQLFSRLLESWPG
ncbi:Beta-barrel assembly machine subunit BamC [Fluviicoccus keumensis]|uniref:Beta-barrel assembly machine subunit BamC n=1 Tax=Fluviicoccus keumensis TaxID=1435465 RepID=A0A4V2G5K7_9GAMM|nr:outer membrane protein assembly factor BamC [Fluviicoccus keumensis]RZU45226.1 Beta-barrel assembly machine subunit BamC [Fluviicoccus keumensis]